MNSKASHFFIPLCTGHICAVGIECFALHWTYPHRLVSRCQSRVWQQCLLDLGNEFEGWPLSSSHSALDTSMQVGSNALLCIGLIHVGSLEDLNLNVFNVIAHNSLDLDSELEGQLLPSSHSALDASI